MPGRHEEHAQRARSKAACIHRFAPPQQGLRTASGGLIAPGRSIESLATCSATTLEFRGIHNVSIGTIVRFVK